MATKAKAPFKVGDRVVSRYDRANDKSRVLIVEWVSKNAASRSDQLIRTSNNDHGFTCSEASLYEAA